MFAVTQTISLGQGERDRQEEGCKIDSEDRIAEVEKDL